MHTQQLKPQPDRRGFFKKCFATAIGIFVGLLPVASGLAVFLDPLRRKASTTRAVRVTTLEALPIDGVPYKFAVVASRIDAWNKFTNFHIGAVYLRRTGEKTLQAFNASCPHAGCCVDYLPERGSFHCPCHQSTFTVEGKIDNPNSPAPRGLDDLKVEIRNGKEVWVEFRNFQAGQAEKIPIA